MDGAVSSDNLAPIPPPEAPWHTQPVQDALARLGTRESGLDDAEATRRLVRFGPNEVEVERATPVWKLALSQFRDPFIYILLVAGAVTLLVGQRIDTAVILSAVVLNVGLGFVQELRARRAILALTALSAPQAEVVRGGRARTVPSREIVPGDVVQLDSGDRVPADLRLLRTRDLAIDESLLTGESNPVHKSADAMAPGSVPLGDQRNMAFAGTTVTRGRGTGVAVRTGAASELGRIAEAMRGIGEPPTPLQQQTARLSRWVGLAVLVLSVAVALAGAIRKLPLQDVLLSTISVAVAAIPEGLPVVLTVTLAVGVRAMARRRAVIRTLPAVETLGSTTVIGSDKTGTLTRNQMTVRTIWAGGRAFEVSGIGYDVAGEVREAEGDVVFPDSHAGLITTLLAGALANEADPRTVLAGEPSGDPTELALLVSAAKGGIALDELAERYPSLDVVPFEPERKYMARLVDGAGGRRVFLKGAPETVLRFCDRQLDAAGDVAPLDRDAVHAATSDLAARGLRVLAMAFRNTQADRIDLRETPSGFVLAGLQGMEDPIREEAVAAVTAARNAGVRVIMLTGDHVATARAIGERLGLVDSAHPAVEGRELDGLDDVALDALLERTNVFARVAPEHKLRIVLRLREQGQVVAVTGDGVNDAPALRAAHIGVAMGRSGTDVAREASDMVLQDDDFATITAAIEEGRVVFANVRKVTFFLLSTGVSMPFIILIALVAGFPLPLLPAQVLWINLVTDGLQDVALAFEPGEPDLLERKPRSPREGVLTGPILQRLAAVGAVLTAGTLCVFWWALHTSGDVEFARTLAMTQMVVFQFFHVFNSRSLDRSNIRVPLLSNRFLFVSLILATAAHVLAVYVPFLQAVFRTTPLRPVDWLLVVAVGVTVVVASELDKVRNRRRGRMVG